MITNVVRVEIVCSRRPQSGINCLSAIRSRSINIQQAASTIPSPRIDFGRSNDRTTRTLSLFGVSCRQTKPNTTTTRNGHDLVQSSAMQLVCVAMQWSRIQQAESLRSELCRGVELHRVRLIAKCLARPPAQSSRIRAVKPRRSELCRGVEL